MPIGANAGGNLNIYVFEVGTIKDLGYGLTLVQTRSIHPLLVAPTEIRWTDTSRSSVQQTLGGSALTLGGRGLKRGQFQGTFGHESRGLAVYLGTGDVLFERFYNEVVRMGEALTSEEMDARVNDLTGTPFIRLLVADADPDGGDLWFINFYDFWDDQSFQVILPNFTWRRSHRQGGATGLVHYTLDVQEVGPPVEGSLGSTLLGLLLDGLTLWADINDAISTYTLANIAEAFVGVAAIIVAQIAATIEALETWVDDLPPFDDPVDHPLDDLQAQCNRVRALMGGEDSADPRTGSSSRAGAAGAGAALDRAARTAADVAELAEATATAAPEVYESAGAEVTTGTDVPGEGSNPGLDRADALAVLSRLEDALAFQRVAGKFFGMSTRDYATFATAGGGASGMAAISRGSATHVVTETDTPRSIESSYQATWAQILELNHLIPEEALRVGRSLSIPQLQQRPASGTGIEGLSTFGSHVGSAALGADWALALSADSANGDVDVVAGDECLSQGIRVLAETFGDSIMAGLDLVPPLVQRQYLSARLSRIFLSDPRVAAVSSVDVSLEDSGAGYSIEIVVIAINGATVTTTGAAT